MPASLLIDRRHLDFTLYELLGVRKTVTGSLTRCGPAAANSND